MRVPIHACCPVAAQWDTAAAAMEKTPARKTAALAAQALVLGTCGRKPGGLHCWVRFPRDSSGIRNAGPNRGSRVTEIHRSSSGPGSLEKENPMFYRDERLATDTSDPSNISIVAVLSVLMDSGSDRSRDPRPLKTENAARGTANVTKPASP